jgi:hypothetical protein
MEPARCNADPTITVIGDTSGTTLIYGRPDFFRSSTTPAKQERWHFDPDTVFKLDGTDRSIRRR